RRFARSGALQSRSHPDWGGGLPPPPPSRRTPGPSPPPRRFGYLPPPHRIGPVRLRDQFLAQARKPCLHALLLNPRKAHAIDSGSARIGASFLVGVAQDVLATNLVVEHVEAEGALRLRLTM